MSDRERVGTLHPDGIRGFRAKCATCDWCHKFDDRAEAEKTLRGHADLSHRRPIHIYRDVLGHDESKGESDG